MTDIATEFGIGLRGGIMNGVPLVKLFTGTDRLPPHLIGTAGVITLTAARYYYTPIYLTAGESFTGARFFNSDTAANGKKVKMAAFLEADSGGLGTLAKSFGEVTLSATAALRNIASSWTVTRTGWHYLALVSDSNPQLYGASPDASNVGSMGLAARLPSDMASTTDTASVPTGYYVGGTYANFPEATGLAPTNVLVGTMGTGTTIPQMRLYK